MFIIREETTFDIADIEALTVAAFLKAQHSSHTEHFIINALRKTNQLALSLVVELDKKLIGHVAISPVQITDGTKGWFGLGPISVLPSYQNQGFGSNLMEAALKKLKAQGAFGCVLLGDPKYYARFGFEANPQLILADVPPAYFLAIDFKGTAPRGFVTYHESFSATD